MATFLDEILKRKQNAATSFLPVNDQEIQEEAERTPVIPETKASDAKPTEAIQQQQSAAQPEVKYPDKPGLLSDDQYEHLLRYNTPEQIATYTAPFDPSKGENYLQRIFESSGMKPQELDQKQLSRARTMGALGDSLRLLGEMFAAAKGAHITKRDSKDSALMKVLAKEEEAYNRYQHQLNKYNDGLFNARLRDFQSALSDYNTGKKGIQSVLAAKDALDERGRQADARLQYNYSKMVQDQGNKDRDFELKKENQKSMENHRKALEAQGWSRVADSKSRTSAYVRKMSSGGGTNDYQMIFEANPNDTENVQQDQFGNSVKVFQMNKGQIDQYYRAALADQEFMNSEAGKALVIQRPKFEGTRMQEGSYKYKPNQDVAAAYLQYQYEKGFIQSPQPTATSDQYMFDWGQSFNNAALTGEEEEVEYPNDEDLDEDFPVLGNMANF